MAYGAEALENGDGGWEGHVSDLHTLLEGFHGAAAVGLPLTSNGKNRREGSNTLFRVSHCL